MDSRSQGTQESTVSVDLPDENRWQPRNRVDRFAVTLYETLLVRWRVLVLFVALVLLFGQFGAAFTLFTRRPGLVLFPLVSVIPALVIVWFIRRQDREREPLGTLAITFVLGGLLANFAAAVNTPAITLSQTVPILGPLLLFYLIVGPGEEFVKWAAIRLYAYDRPEFDVVVDGAVYGAVAGLGFASIENVIYILEGTTAAIQAGTPVGALFATVAETTFARMLAGPGHVIYSSIAGYYLGMAKFNPRNYGPLVVKGLLIAAFLHGTYDFHTATILPILEPILGIYFLVAFFGPVLLIDGAALVYLLRKIHGHQQKRTETPSGGEPARSP